MKFGNQDTPNTISTIVSQVGRKYISHVTGLNLDRGSKIYAEMKGDALLLEGMRAEEISTEKGFGGYSQPTLKQIEIKLREIKSVDILDESGRSLGKTALWGAVGALTLGPLGLIGGALIGARKRYKSFIVLEIAPENKPPYSIVMGGEKQSEVRDYYDHLIKLIHGES